MRLHSNLSGVTLAFAFVAVLNTKKEFVAFAGEVDCPPGRSNHILSVDSLCGECESGFFKSDSGPGRCTACQPGSAQKSYGSTHCEACAFGSYSSDRGATECTSCPPNTYNYVPQRASNAFGVLELTQREDCRPIPGFFGRDGEAGTRCPEGGVCCTCDPAIDLSQQARSLAATGRPCPLCLSGAAAPLALQGYVVSERNNSHSVGRPSTSVGPFVLPCIPPEACTGGPPQLADRDGCAPGYTGRRCGECEDAFFRLGRQCAACTDAIGWPTAVLSALVVLLCAFEGRTFVRSSVSVGMPTLFRFLETLALLKYFDLRWPEPVVWVFEASALSNFDPSVLRLGCFLGPPSTPVQALVVPFAVNGVVVLCWLVCTLMYIAYTRFVRNGMHFSDITPPSTPDRNVAVQTVRKPPPPKMSWVSNVAKRLSTVHAKQADGIIVTRDPGFVQGTTVLTPPPHHHHHHHRGSNLHGRAWACVRG